MKRLAAVVLVAVALAGCGGSGKTASPGTTTATIATATNPTGTTARFHYPPSLVRSYMRTCTNNGRAKASVCACTLRKLSTSVSVADFRRMGQTRTVPPRIRRAISRAALACTSG